MRLDGINKKILQLSVHEKGGKTSVVTFKLVMYQLAFQGGDGPHSSWVHVFEWTLLHGNVDHVDFDSWAKKGITHLLWVEVIQYEPLITLCTQCPKE